MEQRFRHHPLVSLLGPQRSSDSLVCKTRNPAYRDPLPGRRPERRSTHWGDGGGWAAPASPRGREMGSHPWGEGRAQSIRNLVYFDNPTERLDLGKPPFNSAGSG